MATQVQFRGGTTTEHSTFTGAAREVTVDTTLDTVVVHDGVTAGGHPLANKHNPRFTGNVGIGTTSPGATLAVNGDLLLGNRGTSYALRMPDWRIYNTTSGNALVFNDYTNERMRIDSSGNVGIGTSSPSGKLEISKGSYGGTAVVNSAADALLISDNASNGISILTPNNTYGSLFFGDGDDTFIGGLRYNHANDNLEIYTNNNERVRIDSLGRVGIGNNSPQVPLHVGSGVAFSTPNGGGSSFNPQVFNSQTSGVSGLGVAVHDGTSNYRASFFVNPSSNVWGLSQTYSSGTPNFVINAAGSERLRIASSGTLSVGTTLTGGMNGGTIVAGDQSGTNGAVALAVKYTGTDVINTFGSTYSTANTIVGHAVRSSTSATNTFLSTTAANLKRGVLQVGGELTYSNAAAQTTAVGSTVTLTERLHITNAGNVGIGTSTPSNKLVIGEGNQALEISPGATTTLLSYNRTGNSYLPIRTRASAHTFSNGSNDFVHIDSSGNLLVGTTAYPTDTTNTASAFGVSSTNGQLRVATNNIHAAMFKRMSTDGAVVEFRRDGSLAGTISVTSSSTAYNTSSDYRLKENVVDIADGITRVKQLQPRRFNFIADAETTVDGFIAHEAQTVVPEAVTGTHNEVDDDGNAVMQGIDQSKLVPLLTAALQEAIAKIETLETKVAALEAN